MPRIVQYNYELAYRPIQTVSGEWIWEPYVDSVFAHLDTAKSRRGIALVDSGSAWCALPRLIARDWFNIDVDHCPREPVNGISGLAMTPYTTFRVKAFGKWETCKVLLLDSSLYLIGRVPFFSTAEIGFFEDPTNRANNRVLFSYP